VKRLGLSCQVGHLDSTRFHVDGVYNSREEEPPAKVIHITQGYSRDHRPDLNQVILQLISENQAGIPLLMASFSTRKGYCKAHCTLGISILRRDSCSGLLWFGSCAKLQ